MTTLDILINELAENNPIANAQDALRYKALRRVGPEKFKELHKRNLAGENFDAMVDQLAVDWANGKV